MRNRRVILLHAYLVCASIVGTGRCASGADYYVAVDGDDAAPGSVAAPFRTIGRAAKALQPGDRCVVRAGVYREQRRAQRIRTRAAARVAQGRDMIDVHAEAQRGHWRLQKNKRPGARS